MKILLPIIALISLGVIGALAAASGAMTISKQYGLPRTLSSDVPSCTPTPSPSPGGWIADWKKPLKPEIVLD